MLTREKPYMKKLIMLFQCLLVIPFISSCGIISKDSKEAADDKMLKTFIVNYASQYEIVDTEEDGSFQVCVKSPDFGMIIESILDDKKTNDITVQDIEEAVKNKPECTKQYSFCVDNEDDGIIKKKFLEEVSRDLAVKAIENIKYTEEWSTEQ